MNNPNVKYYITFLCQCYKDLRNLLIRLCKQVSRMQTLLR